MTLRRQPKIGAVYGAANIASKVVNYFAEERTSPPSDYLHAESESDQIPRADQSLFIGSLHNAKDDFIHRAASALRLYLR